MKGNTLLFLTRHRAISQVLVIAALMTAMGTDALAQAGVAVRAEAVVNVAERMALRFSHAFARKHHQPAVRYTANRPAAMAETSVPVIPECRPAEAFRQTEQLLYLPPPSLA